MKTIALIIATLLSTFSFVYAAESDIVLYAKAARFAAEYAAELKSKAAMEKIDREIFSERTHAAQSGQEDTRNRWEFDAKFKPAGAGYKEKEANVKSDFKVFYPEFLFSAARHFDYDIPVAVDFSIGQSATAKETWYISDMKYQTNDLNFFRANLKGNVGKTFYLDESRQFGLTPFLGYGFRFINFQRSNFNILNLITIRDTVNEKYYIHHGDIGFRANQKINDKFGISGALSYSYVFYNEADNSILGKIKGKGGYLFNVNMGMEYYLTDSIELLLGGFVELQHLKGGTKNDIIWPDNDLNTYGGEVGVKYKF